MYYLILTLHIIVCVGLILIILLQAGKSAGLSGLFGGGSAENIFSTPSGGSFLKKATITMAVIFALTSLSLTILFTRMPSRSVVERMGAGQLPITQQPVAPALGQPSPTPEQPAEQE